MRLDRQIGCNTGEIRQWDDDGKELICVDFVVKTIQFREARKILVMPTKYLLGGLGNFKLFVPTRAVFFRSLPLHDSNSISK